MKKYVLSIMAGLLLICGCGGYKPVLQKDIDLLVEQRLAERTEAAFWSYSQITDVESTDLLGVGDDPSGSPSFKNATVANVFACMLNSDLVEYIYGAAPSTDPDVDAVGEIGIDTDDFSIRGYDGTNQFVYGQKNFPIVRVIDSPLYLRDDTTTPIWINQSGFTYHITSIYAYSTDDDTGFTLLEVNDMTDFTDTTTIEAITVDTDGTSVYYENITSGIDHTAIETGHGIIFDNDGTDDPDWIIFIINGWFDGDVD